MLVDFLTHFIVVNWLAGLVLRAVFKTSPEVLHAQGLNSAPRTSYCVPGRNSCTTNSQYHLHRAHKK